jgi:asparagine synthase (glutamine-hydrolysing)
MAVSLETRAPFLDTALMDYVFTLPGHQKLRGRTPKWILKKAFEDLLPPSIANRPKMGFGMPLGTWFRGALKGYVSERLRPESARIYNYLKRPYVTQMLDEHMEGRRDWGFQFWTLLMLELWLQGREGGQF